MGISKEYLINAPRLSRATINRKEREDAALSSNESERVLGVENMIGMVQESKTGDRSFGNEPERGLCMKVAVFP